MPKERTRRYSIEIKDATGRSVWFAAADWTDEERRIAIAQNSRLCGMPDENCFTEAPEKPTKRCILRLSNIVEPLPKWVRVRPFADVKIGEPVFTVGAPQGLELSLADGIVSSKRSIDEGRLIQTSAPISKGSSGGGLFDAEGNLVGITTFMLKDAQNLNFAIAAEEYAK